MLFVITLVFAENVKWPVLVKKACGGGLFGCVWVLPVGKGGVFFSSIAGC